MLDVHGGEHVDARSQELLDVLIALPMPATGSVRVRELVHKQDLRLALERRIEVELPQGDAAMLDRAAFKLLEPVEQRSGVGTRMGLDIAGNHIEPLLFVSMGVFEHRVGLPDACRVAEEYLEFAAPRLVAALGLFDLAQNRIGIAPYLKGTVVNHKPCPRFTSEHGGAPHETARPSALCL